MGSVVLLCQAVCAYLGLKCYLTIIRDQGGVVGVLCANLRKIFTIILSFTLWKKSFNERHFVGLLLVFLGVYLGFISKKTSKKGRKRERKSSSSRKASREKQKNEV